MVFGAHGAKVQARVHVQGDPNRDGSRVELYYIYVLECIGCLARWLSKMLAVEVICP
jgi:hypothetical protein